MLCVAIHLGEAAADDHRGRRDDDGLIGGSLADTLGAEHPTPGHNSFGRHRRVGQAAVNRGQDLFASARLPPCSYGELLDLLLKAVGRVTLDAKVRQPLSNPTTCRRQCLRMMVDNGGCLDGGLHAASAAGDILVAHHRVQYRDEEISGFAEFLVADRIASLRCRQ